MALLRTWRFAPAGGGRGAGRIAWLGGLASLLAALGALALSAIVSARLLNLPVEANPWLLLWGPGRRRGRHPGRLAHRPPDCAHPAAGYPLRRLG